MYKGDKNGKGNPVGGGKTFDNRGNGKRGYTKSVTPCRDFLAGAGAEIS